MEQGGDVGMSDKPTRVSWRRELLFALAVFGLVIVLALPGAWLLNGLFVRSPHPWSCDTPGARQFAQVEWVAGNPKLPESPQEGYIFEKCRTIAGQAIDWKSEWAMSAKPEVYSPETRYTFIARGRLGVWGKDLGESRAVDDFPADPQAEGWTERPERKTDWVGGYVVALILLGILAGGLLLVRLAVVLAGARLARRHRDPRQAAG